VSLGLLLLDGILQAFVWFSAGHASRATLYVIWKVFCGFIFGFPAGHVSWGCLSVIWMVLRCLFDLFTCLLSFGYRHVEFLALPVYHISSVSISSYCYPMVCASLPVACEAHPVEIRVWRSRSNSSSGI